MENTRSTQRKVKLQGAVLLERVIEFLVAEGTFGRLGVSEMLVASVVHPLVGGHAQVDHLQKDNKNRPSRTNVLILGKKIYKSTAIST